MSDIFYNDKEVILDFISKDKYRLGINLEMATKLLGLCNSVYNGLLVFYVENTLCITQEHLTNIVIHTISKMTPANIKKKYNSLVEKSITSKEDSQRLISYYCDMRCYILDFLYCASQFTKQFMRRANDCMILRSGIYVMPFFSESVALKHNDINLDRFLRPIYFFPNRALIGEEREKMLDELNISNEDVNLDNDNISSIRLLTFLPVDLLVKIFCKFQYDIKQKHNIFYLHSIPLFDRFDYFVPSLTFLNVLTKQVGGYWEGDKRGYSIFLKDQISIPPQTKDNVLKFYKQAKMPMHLDVFGFDWNIKQKILNHRTIMLGSYTTNETQDVLDNKYYSMQVMDELIKQCKKDLPEDYKEFIDKKEEERQKHKVTAKQIRKDIEDSVVDMAKFFS